MPMEMGSENPCKEQRKQSTWNLAVETLCSLVLQYPFPSGSFPIPVGNEDLVNEKSDFAKHFAVFKITLILQIRWKYKLWRGTVFKTIYYNETVANHNSIELISK